MSLSLARSLLAPALLSLACLTTGCVDDDPALYSADGELVGGTATSARPEIGTFFNGAGGGCTATLISPRTVAVAAHCLSPQYTATAPVPGASFSFTDLGGIGRTIAVDRVHSFATKRFEYLPVAPFTSDLAVLHLASAVPIAQAVPAALASQEPTTGAQSTIFGFGCTDRTPQSGGGFKQFLTFNYGTATTALCWGDSGGPVVFGPQAGTGAVWGVNSDFNVGWDIGWAFPDGWTDLWADVPFYRKQLEDLTRSWDGADEVGMNRPGLDYAQDLVATVAACRTLCEGDGACRAFTYVPEPGGGRCWRKSGASESVPGTGGVVSGLPRRLEVGVDRAGTDYSATAAADAETCAGRCGRDPSCAAFTYASGTCWLKSGTPAVATCATCTSGVPRRGYESGINRPGFDFLGTNVGTAQKCAQTCAEDHRCEAYTFTGAPTGTNCWLKDGVPGAGVVAGMTSGVRRGVETNTNRWGSDYRSFTTTTVSPALCQATCAAENQCQAWTYVPPPSNGNDATCYLKNAVPARSTLAGVVSGVKGLEFMP